MNALDDPSKSDTLALFQNAIGASPPGWIASLEDVDAKLVVSHGRLKASVVGKIKLNASEIDRLNAEGQRFVQRMAITLGVDVLANVFTGRATGRRGAHSNYQAHG